MIAAADAALSTRRRRRSGEVGGRPAGHRHQLAWALQDRPDLLTGAGADAPIRSVLRLIDTLCDVGASAIIRPPCPRCGRVIRLHRPIDGKWLCRNCTAKTRAQPCARCGAVREAATRDEHGRPLCAHCLITDPANRETCIECGRRRPVSVRTDNGPLCGVRTSPVLTCAICGRTAACVVSTATGKPWCFACQQRWIRCAGCGQVARCVAAPSTSRCARCAPGPRTAGAAARAAANPDDCTTGGALAARSRSACTNCSPTTPGTIPPTGMPSTGRWPRPNGPTRSARRLDAARAPVLRELAGRARRTHRTLDELPTGKTVEHLRSVLSRESCRAATNT